MSIKQPHYPELPEWVDVIHRSGDVSMPIPTHRESIYEGWFTGEMMDRYPGWREL